MIVRELATGRDTTFAAVSEIAWQDKGTALAFAVTAENGVGNGVQLFDTATGALRVLDSSASTYSGLSWRKSSAALAVLRSSTDASREGPNHALLVWQDVAASTPRASWMLRRTASPPTFAWFASASRSGPTMARSSSLASRRGTPSLRRSMRRGSRGASRPAAPIPKSFRTSRSGIRRIPSSCRGRRSTPAASASDRCWRPGRSATAASCASRKRSARRRRRSSAALASWWSTPMPLPWSEASAAGMRTSPRWTCCQEREAEVAQRIEDRWAQVESGRPLSPLFQGRPLLDR